MNIILSYISSIIKDETVKGKMKFNLAEETEF